MVKKLILILTALAFVTGCDGGGGDGNSQSPGGGSEEGGGQNPNPPPTPAPQKPTTPNFAQMWKNRRMLYRTISKDGVDICKAQCLGTGLRTSSMFRDVTTGQRVPQLIAWNVYLKYSANSSMDITFPIMADRGDFSLDNGKMIYHFEGPLTISSGGDYTSTTLIHVELEDVSATRILLKAKIKNAFQNFSGEWLLEVIEDTKIVDPPANHSGGKIALYEEISKDARGFKNGWRCSFSVHPDGGRYTMKGELSVIRMDQDHYLRGVWFGSDRGLFALLEKLWTFKADEIDNPEAARWESASAFLPEGKIFHEIAIYSDGPRRIATISPRQEEFKDKLRELCNIVRRP